MQFDIAKQTHKKAKEMLALIKKQNKKTYNSHDGYKRWATIIKTLETEHPELGETEFDIDVKPSPLLDMKARKTPPAKVKTGKKSAVPKKGKK